MPDSYLLNAFFETQLLTGRLAESQGIDAALAGLLHEARDGQIDRMAVPVQTVAECGLRLAARFTRDIGAGGGGRYRWEWEASIERGTPGFRSGPFWSLLYSPHQRARAGVELEDPRLPWILIEEPNLRFRDRPGGLMWEHHHRLELVPGEVVMFPAWIRCRMLGQDPVLRIDLWALLNGESSGQ
jgi:hypothetical protein